MHGVVAHGVSHPKEPKLKTASQPTGSAFRLSPPCIPLVDFLGPGLAGGHGLGALPGLLSHGESLGGKNGSGHHRTGPEKGKPHPCSRELPVATAACFRTIEDGAVK